jgi:hypothetical protein
VSVAVSFRATFRPGAVALLAALLVAAPAAPAGAADGTFAGSIGVKVPRGAQADVRAIDRSSGAVAEVRELSRTGAFRLALPPGGYLVVGTVVTRSGPVVQKRIGVTLRSGQARRRAKLTARKRKRRRPRAQAAFVQEGGQVTPGRIAVGIDNVTGTTGDREWDTLRGGINDLMIVDVMNAGEDCGTTLIEVERRAEALRELEFQQSPYVDPSTRLTRNLIIGDVALNGVIAAAPDGGAKLTMDIVDMRSGGSLGTREITLRPDGVFDQLEGFAKQIADDLCKLSDVYTVQLDVNGTGRFATHTSAATMSSALRATRSGQDRAVWRASGPLQWTGVTFTTTNECAFIDYVIPAVAWSVAIEDAGGGMLSVTWRSDGNDSTTASVDCPSDGENDPPPVPGLAGTALLATGPDRFVVPHAGGTVPVAGEVSDGGDGFFNTGTITVTPSGVAGP